MILASVFIRPLGGAGEAVLPPRIAENISSFKERHPGLPHKLFTHEDIIALLEAKFPREVLDAFNVLRPFAYKADLARYCILYEFGGIYADLSMFFVRPLPLPAQRPVVFRDFLLSSSWDTCTGLVAAPRRHKALRRAIELVCANVRREYYGSTCLCPTGPALFGKALAATCEAEDVITGRSIRMKPERLREIVPGVELPDGTAIHCQALDDKLVAVKRKQMFSAGLVDHGVADSDIYYDQWKNREVYEQQAPPWVG